MPVKTSLLAATACVSALIPAVAAAQAAQNPGQLQEIIVTARKRQESILNVPVVETAIPQQKLERLQTQDLKDLSTLVPGLSLGTAVLSVGTQVSLRGVGTSSLDAGVDQSVALNLDGLQLTQGLAYSAGMFDVGQVEVLKGPQALFYGKNSPGGVISIRTADPTDRFEVIARAGHEFYAQENRAELIVSGPVTDSLKLRLATMYDHQEGYFTNAAVPAPGTGAIAPANRSFAPDKNYIIRGTALWSPNSQFDARLKLNYVHDRTEDAGGMQLASCPDGTGAPLGIQFIGGNDCKIDRTIYYVSLDPNAFIGIRNGGHPFLESTQAFGTLEMNYRPRPDLTLTSTTGYYNLRSDSMINGTETGFAGSPLAADNHFKRHDFTQEFRANSDFAGPLNFTAGAYLQDAELTNVVTILGNTALHLPPVMAKGSHDLEIKSHSAFAQGRYKLLPSLEIAAGARWTHETRSDSPELLNGPTPIPVTLAVPKIESDNVSPELTITYRPTDNITAFGSLKKGYKSGSFTVTTPVAPGANNSFGDEKVEGGEIGLKTRWLDRRLAMDLAAYDYRYTGLQTSANEIAQNGLPQVHTLNAGSALIYGVDFDLAYHPELVDGLTLHGAVNWNRARFKTLDNVPCYGGQTIAAGCNQVLNPSTGLFTSQSLSGAPLVRAPEWQTNFGFDYEIPIGNDLTVALTSNTQYSSKYLTDLGNRADYYQKGFFKTDMSVTLLGPKDRWEVSVIGKNLTDKLTTGNCTNLNYQGGQILGGQITGGTGRGPAGVDELVCNVDRGREVWLRLTLKPFN
jgi:iron complex outermembrane receptor protein